MSKPRVIKAFDKLESDIQEQIKLAYPRGFEKHLVRFKDHKNKFVSALPFETEDRYYMVRMSLEEAHRIILNDDDYNAQGHLKEAAKEAYADKFGDEDDEDDLDIDELEMDGSGEDMED